MSAEVVRDERIGSGLGPQKPKKSVIFQKANKRRKKKALLSYSMWRKLNSRKRNKSTEVFAASSDAIAVTKSLRGHSMYSPVSDGFLNLPLRKGSTEKSNSKLEIRSQSPTDSSPELLDAASKGNKKLVKKLLKDGANPWFIDNETGDSPLSLACQCSDSAGSASVVQTLLNAGVSPDSPGLLVTPLCVASVAGHADTVRLLLKAGASATHEEELTKRVALHFAAEAGKHNVVELLIASWTPIDRRTADDMISHAYKPSLLHHECLSQITPGEPLMMRLRLCWLPQEVIIKQSSFC